MGLDIHTEKIVQQIVTLSTYGHIALMLSVCNVYSVIRYTQFCKSGQRKRKNVEPFYDHVNY